MEISDKQIKGKPKVVGSTENGPVLSMTTKGGLHLILGMNKGGKTETLAMGSHPALARHIASKKADITWNSLEKSEARDTETFKELIPKYEKLTDEIRELENKE